MKGRENVYHRYIDDMFIELGLEIGRLKSDTPH